MDVAFTRKNGFIHFTANTKEELSREQAQTIQEKFGEPVVDNGFYAFVKRKNPESYTIKWCCRDNSHKLTNVGK
jgi:hypothetical protein